MLREVTCERIVFCNGAEIKPTGMFRALVQAHVAHVPGTAGLEQAGQVLQQAGFPDDYLRDFIRDVCAWGGHWGPQIAAHILEENDLDAIRGHFADAVDVLLQDSPDVGQALEAIKEIDGLGVSFGSKHLRFLKPSLCPVLDKNISGRFWHPLSVAGYKCLSHDCLKIARKLRECGPENPIERPNNEWLAADVEMGLFAFAKEWHLEV
jgi:hypothetical protein